MNLKHYILTKDKRIKEVPLMEWAMWFETSPDRIIARSIVKNVRVSTAFLGLDHSFSTNPKAKPVLFETMMFSTSPRVEKVIMGKKIKMLPDLKHKALREYQVRYHTLKEAEEGHKYAVKFAEYILGIRKTEPKELQ